MALKKISFSTGPEDAKKRLDQVLAERLPELVGQPLSKGRVRKLIVAGAVYLNGRRVRIASKELIPRARIDAYIDFAKLGEDAPTRDRAMRSGKAYEIQPADVLFEDEYLIAINKPAGLPTQPTLDEARDNLFAAVKKFLAARDGVVDPYVGLHHRLDRDTSGVVLFTKKKEANAGVAELFTRHLAVKTYNALSARPDPDVADADLPKEWVIKNYLGKAKNTSGKQARFTAVRSGGDFAHTDFRLLEAMPSGLWVEAKPRTGRTHQIRVHLFEHGIPILGDPLYRDARTPAREAYPRTLLHAVNLTFPHPVSKVEVSIHSPIPEDFNQCLQRLRERARK